jgi:hypothetical protein
MIWLWLLFPVLLLGVAAALWRATARIDRERVALDAEITALRASGPEQAPR